MGYSARYHAASLAAVFLALAVGILVGVGFASDVVSGTAEDLEQSLTSDLAAARAENDDLEARIEDEQRFGTAVFPAVVSQQLRDDRVAVIALGGLPDATGTAVEEAIESAGGQVSQVAVVGEPPDLEALASTLGGKRAQAIAAGDEAELNALGVDAGRVMTRGGPRFEDLRGTLLSRYSGSPERTDAVVVVSDPPDDLAADEKGPTRALEDGLLAGLRSVQLPVVGAELSTTDPSTIGFFDAAGLSSVDSADLPSGKVALVYALKGGVEGSFGVKVSADSLLPDLLTRAEVERAERSRGQGGEKPGKDGG